MPEYLPLDELKQRLGITGTSQDAQLDALLDAVEAMIQTYLGYDPSEDEAVDYYDTNGTFDVALRRWPITNIVAAWLDEKGNYGQTPGSFADDTLLVPGVDYVLVQTNVSTTYRNNWGILRRLLQPWPWTIQYTRIGSLSPMQVPTPGCLKVSYTFDNAQILAIATQAGLLEATAQYRSQLAGFGYLTSDSMDGASVSISPMQRSSTRRDPADGFVSPIVGGMLSPWRQGRFV